jgi:gas vesicle protein
MTKQIEKKQTKSVGVNPVIAAVTGAIVGAGVIVAGAVAYNDKKNRDMVKKAVSNVKETAHDIKKLALDKKNEVQNMLKNDKQKVDRVIDSTKKIVMEN